MRKLHYLFFVLYNCILPIHEQLSIEEQMLDATFTVYHVKQAVTKVLLRVTVAEG